MIFSITHCTRINVVNTRVHGRRMIRSCEKSSTLISRCAGPDRGDTPSRVIRKRDIATPLPLELPIVILKHSKHLILFKEYQQIFSLIVLNCWSVVVIRRICANGFSHIRTFSQITSYLCLCPPLPQLISGFATARATMETASRRIRLRIRDNPQRPRSTRKAKSYCYFFLLNTFWSSFNLSNTKHGGV